ncbi:MAG: hypothetical protein FJZ08_00630 [Candidatus Omnitrophica bacterium]|nr:hypothetical protein [Candidatus Omnitrophota bacterium]
MYISVGLSTEKDPAMAAKEAARLAISNMHTEKTDLAIVFSSIDLAYPVTLKMLSSSLAHTPIIGASGAAIITNQGVFKHGLAVMLLSFPTGVSLNTAYTKDIKAKTSLNAGRELGNKLLSGFRDMRRVISVIFSDGLMDDGSNFIYGLQERLGKSFPLAGASASDNMRFTRTYTFFNQEIFSDGSSGMILGGRLNFGLGIKHGWNALGKPRIVTKAAGNIVYEIDDRPAVKIYEGYLNRNILELKKELKRISVLYPIGIYLSGEEEYLLRNILSIEDDGSMRLHGNIAEGSSIRLMIGTKESCLNATQQATEEAKKALYGQIAPLEKRKQRNFALVFNSTSRYMLLKKDSDKEVDIIKEGLGSETPFIGLYTYGEQAPLQAVSYQGQAYFHNQTIAILAFGG